MKTLLFVVICLNIGVMMSFLFSIVFTSCYILFCHCLQPRLAFRIISVNYFTQVVACFIIKLTFFFLIGNKTYIEKKLNIMFTMVNILNKKTNTKDQELKEIETKKSNTAVQFVHPQTWAQETKYKKGDILDVHYKTNILPRFLIFIWLSSRILMNMTSMGNCLCCRN